MKMKRRDFLSHAAAGGAILTMPAFLSGCSVQQAVAVAEPVPDNPFMDWFGVDPAWVARVMSELTSNGADAADIYFQHKRGNSLALENGVVAIADSMIEQGVGLRVVIGDQTGYAFTENLTPDAMLEAARTAAAIASASRAAAPQAFTPKDMGGLYTTRVPWTDVGIDRKMPVLEYVENTAMASDPSIEKVSVHWRDEDERIMIATLDGNLITDHRPMTRVTLLVTARKGEEVQSGFSNIAAREEIGWYTEERLDAMIQEAVDRTLILFDARRPPEGEIPVILASGASGVLLHEAIGHGMEADFAREGKSIYADMIGKKVAAPTVTVVDQATIPRERGALNFDDEGNATGRTVLVENGILKSFLHDGISAKQYGQRPTGSGRRQSYRFAPMPRMSCTFMESGPHSKDEIIEAVDFGVICETYTNGEVDLGAGNFTFSVKNGWLVERGRVTAPVKDLKIAGNGPEVLERVTMVAGDARMDSGGWSCGKKGQTVPVSQGIPTVLVSGMKVTGAS